MGVGGAGDEADGSPASHYSLVDNTCVACHLGANDDHTFLPSVGACQDCHADLENFDLNGAQTEVAEKLETLGGLLEAAGMWEETEDGGHPVVGVYPAAEAQALWNYIFVAVEDSSHGVHNPAYTNALLDWSIAAMGGE
jgi:hypothetical protein